MKTLQEMAAQALDVQDACNMSGIARSFAQAMLDLKAALPDLDTNGWNQHPITQLWASKIHDLARMGLSDTEAFGRAYDACKEMAGRT